jgi:MFS family permease
MAYDAALLSKRFRPLYVAAFLQGIIFWYSIEKLFMQGIGFDAKKIASAIIILNIVNIAANTPIGVLADRWSRKGVLILASLELAFASVMGGLSHGYWQYVVAACFSGLFMASYSGLYDSVVYDTLLEESVPRKMFNRYYSRLRFYDGIALIIGSLLSSPIAHFMGLRATYFLTVPFALAAIGFLFIFKEPKEHKQSKPDALLHHLGATAKAVFHNRQVLWIGLNLVLISLTSALVLNFDQLWFIALGLPLLLYGPFDGLLLSSFSVGGFLSERLASPRALLSAGVLSILSAAALLIHQVYVVVVAQTIILIAMVMYGIAFEKLLHDNVASKVRVGAASIVGTAARLAFLPMAYIVGRISDNSGIFRASWLLIILLSILLVTSTRVMLAPRNDS